MTKLSFQDWYAQEQEELLNNFKETGWDKDPDFNLQVAIEVAYLKYLKQTFTITKTTEDTTW